MVDILLGPLTLDQKQERQKKVNSFFKFIGYDWGDDKYVNSKDKTDIKDKDTGKPER